MGEIKLCTLSTLTAEELDPPEIKNIILFVHNVVIKLLTTGPINCAELAVKEGGLYTKEYHAGPTTISTREPINASYRLFKNCKINAAGLKTFRTAIASIWLLLWRVVKQTKEVVFPIDITCTNIQMSAYLPFEVDLTKVAKRSSLFSYDPNISCARVPMTTDSNMQLSLFKSALVITGAQNTSHARAALARFYHLIEECKIKDINALEQRAIKAKEGDDLQELIRRVTSQKSSDATFGKRRRKKSKVGGARG